MNHLNDALRELFELLDKTTIEESTAHYKESLSREIDSDNRNEALIQLKRISTALEQDALSSLVLMAHDRKGVSICLKLGSGNIAKTMWKMLWDDIQEGDE